MGLVDDFTRQSLLLYDAIEHVVVIVVVVISSSSCVATAAAIVIRIIVVVVVVIVSKAHVWLFLNENHIGMIHGFRSHRYE